MTDLDAWNDFRRNENPSATDRHLPCACCDKETTEEDSAHGAFGDYSNDDYDVATLCMKCADDEVQGCREYVAYVVAQAKR